MNPPIPEPMAVSVPIERGPRPSALKYLLAVEIILLLIWEIASAQNPVYQEDAWGWQIFNVVMWIVWIWILWSLWNGKNWARRVVLAANVLCFFLLLVSEVLPVVIGFSIGLADKTAAADFLNEMRTEETIAERYCLVIYTAFSMVWFFWLQSRTMKAFCLKPTREN